MDKLRHNEWFQLTNDEQIECVRGVIKEVLTYLFEMCSLVLDDQDLAKTASQAASDFLTNEEVAKLIEALNFERAMGVDVPIYIAITNHILNACDVKIEAASTEIEQINKSSETGDIVWQASKPALAGMKQ